MKSFSASPLEGELVQLGIASFKLKPCSKPIEFN